jgi:hypothetical protein
MSAERWFRKKLQMQGAQKMRNETQLQVRRRWTFYEIIKGEHRMVLITAARQRI